MALAPGTRLGGYEILSLIGRGGMGEVYRACDTRLDRTVALKVLPQSLADDPEFRERFDREARAISRLTHPHICTLYDVGGTQGTAFLVMEHLDGETLENRLTKGAVPCDEALNIVCQIADALDAAHRAGIVHRDLKPGNIMLTKGGAKLLDFGLVKTGATVTSTISASRVPTTPPKAVTARGTLIGTFQYMAPEQVDGEDADARADIFAFGCVLYEMLTGRRAFDGKTPASVFGAILKDVPPPVSTSAPLASPSLDHLVARCLAKDPENRWQTARDLKAELEWIARSNMPPTPAAVSSTPERRRLSRLAIAAVVACAVVVVTTPTAIRHWSEIPTTVRPIWFHFRPADGYTIAATRNAPQFAVSPDGQKVVYAAISPDGRSRLWLQRFDAPVPKLISGSDDGTQPFWAADSRWIGFASAQKLVKVDADFGTTQPICNITAFSGGTWNRTGEIVFSTGRPRLLYRVSAAGGTPVPLTTLDPGRREQSHTSPQFLDDGRHLLFSIGAPEANGIVVTELEHPTTRKLIASVDTMPIYASRHLIFARGATLLAQTFDADRLELIGDPVPIANSVGSAYSASSNGVLAFRPAFTADVTQLSWFNRQGQVVGTVGERAGYQTLSLAPNERQIATEITDPRTGQTDVWILDAVRNITSRLTFTHGPDEMPVWSPDATRIAFASHRGAHAAVFAKPSGGGPEEPMAADGHVVDWSADGRYLLLVNVTTDVGLWAVATSGDRKPFPVVSKSQGRGVQGSQFSPDGRWVVYASDESGQPQVYVTTFPTATTTWQISNAGGDQPRWPRNSGEIIYVAADSKLMSVSVKRGSAFEAAAPKPLFEIRANRGINGRVEYAVSSDGQRFLINTQTGDPSAQSETTVILNWPALLKK